jgi:hypothetical protein
MCSVRRLSIVFCSAMWVLVAGRASAQQMIPPGWSQFNPPPPSPQIEVPVVPRMDVPSRPSVQRTPHTSFSDRIARCLDEGAAAGLGPGARAAYSRSCANQ